MLFTSYAFLAFLATLCIVYYLVPKIWQPGILLIASYMFYAASAPKYLLYLWAVTLIVYVCALQIDKNLSVQKAYLKEHKEALSREDKKIYKLTQKKRRFRWQLLCVFLCVGILAVVKYTNFLFANINTIMEAFGGTTQLSFVSIALPMGISYYTLQALSYLFDVARGTIKAERSILRFALFVGFFPQLIQGPISRYGQLSETLFKEHDFEWRRITLGMQRILGGYFKKLVIADRIAPAVTTIISDVTTYDGAYAFFGMLFYTIQLYADFTGGIDVTIGVAEMLGIDVAENFNLPYFSISLKEYWRRWHISMCNWFRDYVFYPVSTSKWMQKVSKASRARFGERIGRRLPVYISSFVVWFLTGIWHGASWNFIAWGLMNYVILMVSEEFEGAYAAFHSKCAWAGGIGWRIFATLRTFLLICALNMFDCYTSVQETFRAFGTMFTSKNWNDVLSGGLLELGLASADYAVLAFGVLAVFATSMFRYRGGNIRETIAAKAYPYRFAVWFGVFVVVLIFGAYGIGYDASQFIYNRF